MHRYSAGILALSPRLFQERRNATLLISKNVAIRNELRVKVRKKIAPSMIGWNLLILAPFLNVVGFTSDDRLR